MGKFIYHTEALTLTEEFSGVIHLFDVINHWIGEK